MGISEDSKIVFSRFHATGPKLPNNEIGQKLGSKPSREIGRKVGQKRRSFDIVDLIYSQFLWMAILDLF